MPVQSAEGEISSEIYKPVQIQQKIADDSSFPEPAALLPRHSFWSSSHRPSKQQIFMLHIWSQFSLLIEKYNVYTSFKLDWCCRGNVFASCSVIASVPCYLLICFIAYDLWLHGKNVFMWGSNQKLTRPFITTCCLSRPHCRWNCVHFPMQKNPDDYQQPWHHSNTAGMITVWLYKS